MLLHIINKYNNVKHFMKKYRLRSQATAGAELIIYVNDNIVPGHFILNHYHAQILQVMSSHRENDLTVLQLEVPAATILSSSERQLILTASQTPTPDKVVGVLPAGGLTPITLDANELVIKDPTCTYKNDKVFWDISNPHQIRTLISLTSTGMEQPSLLPDSQLNDKQIAIELAQAKKESTNMLATLRLNFMKTIGINHVSLRQVIRAIPANIIDFLGGFASGVPIPFIHLVWSKVFQQVKEKAISWQVKHDKKLFADKKVHPFDKMDIVSQYTIDELTTDIGLTYWQTMSAYANTLQPVNPKEPSNEITRRRHFFKWYATHQTATEKLGLLRKIINHMHDDLVMMENTAADRLKSFRLPRNVAVKG